MKTFILYNSDIVHTKEIEVESSEALYQYVIKLFDNKEIEYLKINDIMVMSPRVTMMQKLIAKLKEYDGEFRVSLVTKEMYFKRESIKEHARDIIYLLVDNLVNKVFKKDVKLIDVEDLNSLIRNFCTKEEITKDIIQEVMLFGVNLTNIEDISNNTELSKKLEKFTTLVSKLTSKTIKNLNDMVTSIYNKSEDVLPDEEIEADDTIESAKESEENKSEENKNEKSSKNENFHSYNHKSSTSSWVNDIKTIGNIAAGVAVVGGLAYMAYKYFSKKK